MLTRFLTLRSMRARFLRIVLSGAGIVLGVAGVLSISVVNQAALDSITRLFENTSGRVSLTITSSSSESGFPQQVMTRVNTIPGVKTAIPVIKAQTLLADQIPDGQVEISFLGTSAGGLLLHGVDPELEPQARDYVIKAGSFLSPQPSTNEIVLVEKFADDNDIRAGDRIEILTPNGLEKLLVVGLMAREGPGLSNNGAFGVISLQVAQQFFNRKGELDQIDIVVVENSSAFLEKLRTSMQSRIGPSLSVTYPANQGQRMTQMLTNYQIGLNFMSAIALFVGAFLIYNAFAMNVIERTREFGMLRTIGMTRRQIVTQMLIEASLLGSIGSLLGVALGLLLSRGLAGLMGTLLGTDLGSIQVPWQALFISVALGLLVTLAAAAVPSLQAGRVSPLSALRIRGIQKSGWMMRHSWKAGLALLIFASALLAYNPFAYDPQFRLGSMTVFFLFLGATLLIPATVKLWERFIRPVLRFVYGSSGILGSRNIQRSQTRTALTVAALMIGVSMILTVQSLTGSFSVDLRTWINSYLGGDLYVSSAVPLRGDIARRLEGVAGVAAVAQIRYLPATFQIRPGESEDITLMAIEPERYSQVTNFVFSDSQKQPLSAINRLAGGDAVFISSVLAEKYQLSAGDQVWLQTRLGFRPFEVAAVVVDFYNQGLVMNASWNDMRRYFRINDASTYLVKVGEGISVAEVEQRIDDLYGKRYRLIMESNQSIRDRVLKLMNQAFQMFDLLAVIAVVIGSLGVINTMTMNVIERTREIGMLRATGMTRSQVLFMILAEAGLMGIIGGVLGLGFGALLAWIILGGMASMSGYSLDFYLPVSAVVTGLVIALFISQLAAIFPARRAARIRTLDAIQYE